MVFHQTPEPVGIGKSGVPLVLHDRRAEDQPSGNRQGPIIQPRSVSQNKASSDCRSSNRRDRAPLDRKPSVTWTAPFGFPVVPDV